MYLIEALAFFYLRLRLKFEILVTTLTTKQGSTDYKNIIFCYLNFSKGFRFRVHAKKMNHFLRTFQGPPTTNINSAQPHFFPPTPSPPPFFFSDGNLCLLCNLHVVLVMVTIYLAQTECILVYQADHYFIPLHLDVSEQH